MNGVTTFQAGNPVMIVQACNRANTDVGGMRPDVVGNPNLPTNRPSGDLVDEFFNTAAFANVCPDTNGPFNFKVDARRFKSYDDFEEMEIHSTILIDKRGFVH